MAGNSDPYGDKVRIPYIQDVGAGEFTLTITAASTSETTNVSVDADGVRQSNFVELTLANQVTGRGPNQRLEVEIEVTSGSVKFLPWGDCFDSTIGATRLHYNTLTTRGGFAFDPVVFAANQNVLGKQIADYEPDLIIVELFDQADDTRDFISALVVDLETRNVDCDVLLTGSTESYHPTDSPDGTSTEQNGVEVDNNRIVAAFYQALAETKNFVQFHDHGAVVRSQNLAQKVGAYLSTDGVHPTEAGNAIFISALIAAMNTPETLRAQRFEQELITYRLRVGSYDTADIDDIGKVGFVEYNSSGDFSFNWERNFHFYNYFNGSAEETGRVDRFGFRTKELRFLGSSAKITSLANGEMDFNTNQIKNIGQATLSTSAIRFDQAARAASSVGSAPTTGGTAGEMRYMTGPNRLFYCLAAGNWFEFASA